MSEGKEAESSNNRDWDVLFNLFAEVLASEKAALKIRAIVKLAKMSRYAPENKLELAVPMLLELLRIPQGNLSPLIQEASAHCLKCIASRGEGKLVNLIGQPHAISTLLSLLPISGEGLQRALLKCLRNVVTFSTNSCTILFSHGGLLFVLDMIDNCSGESKWILLEILSALALIKEVRMHLLNSTRVHLLVEAAKYGSMISRTRAAQAIGLLGLTKRSCRLLVGVGALPVLIRLLEEGNPSTKLVAGNALGVISSCINHIRLIALAPERVISLYVELLQGSDFIGKEIAEDVLSVLAVCEENAIPIIEQLVRILRGNDPEAKAAAADVIWDLSSYEYSSPVLQNSGAISVLVELLEDENIDVREKVAGAIAQLSQNEADRAFLANCGVIPRLINVLDNGSDELRDNAAEALVNFSLDSSLGDQISSITENPTFQNMHDRLMQIRASDEHLDVSLRRMTTEQHI
ncbi:hypothetical protein ACS0TY_033385 [Phlomoides rotata]